MTRAIFNPYRVDKEKEERQDGAVAEELISGFVSLIVKRLERADGVWRRLKSLILIWNSTKRKEPPVGIRMARFCSD